MFCIAVAGKNTRSQKPRCGMTTGLLCFVSTARQKKRQVRQKLFHLCGCGTGGACMGRYGGDNSRRCWQGNHPRQT